MLEWIGVARSIPRLSDACTAVHEGLSGTVHLAEVAPPPDEG